MKTLEEELGVSDKKKIGPSAAKRQHKKKPVLDTDKNDLELIEPFSKRTSKENDRIRKGGFMVENDDKAMGFQRQRSRGKVKKAKQAKIFSEPKEQDQD